MTWQVHARLALDAWREEDQAVRDAMLEWFAFLTTNGPPRSEGYAEALGCHVTTAPGGQRVHYYWSDAPGSPRYIAVVRIR